MNINAIEGGAHTHRSTGCLLQGKVRENLEKSGKKIISGKVRENKGKMPKTGKSQGNFL